MPCGLLNARDSTRFWSRGESKSLQKGETFGDKGNI